MASAESIKKTFDSLFKEVEKRVIGQEEVVEQVVIAILCDANALLEGYPGLAKTLLVRTLSEVMDLSFSRIQSTPDLMPSDVTGTYVLQEEKGKRVFKFQEGPVFANMVLVDEVNRATPKTQSALLEAMQEKQITVGRETFLLEKPFFILATQNPIEQEGTFLLPEAQSDRFIFKILTKYPTPEEEERIIDMYTGDRDPSTLRKVLSRNNLLSLQKYVREVPISNSLKKRIVRIVEATRKGKSLIEYGASPRASMNITLAAKAKALISGRKHVTSSDIEAVAVPVLRHRIILNFEAERKGVTPDDAILEILKKVK
jgi:MoxR-like ATPase